MTRSAPSELANFRDLDELPTEDGRVTRAGVLYRSDAPYPGDRPPDAPCWPPAVVLDLRSADELDAPHPLRAPGTEVYSFPLLGEARPLTVPELRDGVGFSIDAMYQELVARAAPMAASVLEHVAGADGPVLVHCAAGKDRTGVLVAILLRAAGVRREAVVADYARTAPAMPRVRRRMTETDAEVARLLAEFPDAVASPPQAIAAVLDRVERDAGVSGWLEANGAAPELIRRWSQRLVGR